MSLKNILFVSLVTIPLENIERHLIGDDNMNQMLCMPLGILYLSSSLKSKISVGNVDIIDYALQFKDDTVSKTIDQFISHPLNELTAIPDIISITLTFACTFAFFEKTVGMVKEKFPNAVIIVGGIQATNSIPWLMLNPSINYAVRGEGEISFPMLVDQIFSGNNKEIKGVYSRDNYIDGQECLLSDCVYNLDTLPFPDWDLIDMKKYIQFGTKKNLGKLSETEKCASLVCSRGCPFHCTFCSSHSTHGRKVRVRSVENIIEEIKLLNSKYGINLIAPEDDLFISDKKRTLELLSGIKSLKTTDLSIQFPNAISVNGTDEELLDAMVDAGMTVVNIAVESGCKFTQKNLIKKNVDLDKVRKIVEYLKTKPSVTTRCTCIFGFPGETKALMRESLEYIKSLGADWYLFVIASPLPGSEMYSQFVARGDIPDSPEAWNQTHFTNRFFDTEEISAHDLNEFVYLANLEANFIHNHSLMSGNYEKALKDFDGVFMKYPFHIIALYSMMRCYQGMKMDQEAERLSTTISEMIKHNTISKEMYHKYGYLIQTIIR